jgi:spoIIIJ-associated protein
MEWIEASATTVAVAVEAAMAELGITDRAEAVVEVLQEPKPGFLGMGKQPAVVKVSRKVAAKSGNRRRSRGSRGTGGRGGRDHTRTGTAGGRKAGATEGGGSRKPASVPGSSGRGSNQGKPRQPTEARAASGEASEGEERTMDTPKVDEATVSEQAAVAHRFIEGLLNAFGLEGTVTSRVEEDTVHIDVDGEQTEALVGSKGSVMQAVHEITRTVVQRSTASAPRMRLDIAGYTERRREALRIYTTKLAERVLNDGGEVMLEPMNAADRKVVHDTVAEIDGVRSFSEGEDPERAVVIAPSG